MYGLTVRVDGGLVREKERTVAIKLRACAVPSQGSQPAGVYLSCRAPNRQALDFTFLLLIATHARPQTLLQRPHEVTWS